MSRTPWRRLAFTPRPLRRGAPDAALARRRCSDGVGGLLAGLGGGAAAETLHLTTRVDDALGAGEERVAHRAHLGLQLRERGPGGERVGAEAGHDSVDVVLGMDLGLHGTRKRTGWNGHEHTTGPE